MVLVETEAVTSDDRCGFAAWKCGSSRENGQGALTPRRFRLFPFDMGGARGNLNEDPERVRENTQNSLVGKDGSNRAAAW